MQATVKGIERRYGGAIGRGKGGAVGGQDQIAVWPDDRAGREVVGEPVEIPTRELERDVRRIVIQLHVLAVGSGWIGHDLVNHELPDGRGQCAVIHDRDIGRVIGERLIVNIHAQGGEVVCARQQCQNCDPIGDGGPGYGVSNAVEPDRAHIDGRNAADQRDIIAYHHGIDREPGGIFSRDLRGDAVVRRGHPGFHRGWIFGVDAVGEERIVFGINQWPAIREIQRTINEFLQRPPIHSPERRLDKKVRGIGVSAVDQKQVGARRPGAVIEADIEIEHQQRILRAIRAQIAVEILCRGCPVRIAVCRGVVGGEDPHPIFHIREALHRGDIVGCAERTGRVYQRIDDVEVTGRIGSAPA